MAFEIEQKYRVNDVQGLAARLAARGVGLGVPVRQVDIYYAHPARDFASTGEAFRARADGSSACLTYKGPKLEGPAKTREEIEVPFAEGRLAEMRTLLERLGFRQVAVVAKSRQSGCLAWGGWDLSIAVDEAEGLGVFVEVEAIAEGESAVADAQAAVVAAAEALGLGEAEPRSYLRMLLERRPA